MTGVADTLALWGILRPAEVVEIAAGTGLDLAAACTMLEKESSCGHNVWGRDPVDTGGFYAKGSEVTRAAYEAWKPHRSRLGSQGVGPTQLTYPPLQDQADRLGGCWDWRINLIVGFRHLAQLQRQHGARGGFRRYNGSGPAAEQYADRSMQLLQRWRTRLPAGSNRPVAPSPPPAPAPAPRAPEEDDVMYIKHQPGGVGSPTYVGLLVGPHFVQLAHPDEIESANVQISRGALEQWVTADVWREFDRRSHALTDLPRPVAIVRDDTLPPPAE